MLGLGAVTINVVTAVLLAELFPTAVRYTASAITYNVAYALFGGTAPFIATLLVALTGSEFAPAGYLTAVAAVSLGVTALLPETAGRPLNPSVPEAAAGGTQRRTPARGARHP